MLTTALDAEDDLTAFLPVKLPLTPFTDEELALIELRAKETGLRKAVQRS